VKTAISLPDPVFVAAEKLAKELRMSRSQLYATAIAEFVAEYKEHHVTTELDAVYGEEDSGLDSGLRKLQLSSFPREDQ
jgi:metal-responsive CopG/Arc/MetJ family transcriptional regulator